MSDIDKLRTKIADGTSNSYALFEVLRIEDLPEKIIETEFSDSSKAVVTGLPTRVVVCRVTTKGKPPGEITFAVGDSLNIFGDSE